MVTHDAILFPLKFSQFYAIAVEITVGGWEKSITKNFLDQLEPHLKAAEIRLTIDVKKINADNAILTNFQLFLIRSQSSK